MEPAKFESLVKTTIFRVFQSKPSLVPMSIRDPLSLGEVVETSILHRMA